MRRAADRAEMVPAIESYMGALDDAMLASSTGGDTQAALTKFDTSRQELQRRLSDTDIAPDVSKGVTTMIADGQALMDKVTANSIGLRDRVTAYAPILLTAEDAINGSVRVDDERIRAETLGLSRAVGARGQMMMQQLLVNLGGELPEPELRTSMITLAGTEPSTLFGMSQVLGVGSPEAQKLQAEFVKRMAIMSDPARVTGQQPGPGRSMQATNQIADKIIADTSSAVTRAVDRPGRGAAQRRDPGLRDRRRRDAAGAANGHPGGAVAGPSAAPAARQRAQGGARRPGPRDRTGPCGWRARSRPADRGAHLRRGRSGGARRRRAARAGGTAGR